MNKTSSNKGHLEEMPLNGKQSIKSLREEQARFDLSTYEHMQEHKGMRQQTDSPRLGLSKPKPRTGSDEGWQIPDAHRSKTCTFIAIALLATTTSLTKAANGQIQDETNQKIAIQTATVRLVALTNMSEIAQITEVLRAFAGKAQAMANTDNSIQRKEQYKHIKEWARHHIANLEELKDQITGIIPHLDTKMQSDPNNRNKRNILADAFSSMTWYPTSEDLQDALLAIDKAQKQQIQQDLLLEAHSLQIVQTFKTVENIQKATKEIQRIAAQHSAAIKQADKEINLNRIQLFANQFGLISIDIQRIWTAITDAVIDQKTSILLFPLKLMKRLLRKISTSTATEGRPAYQHNILQLYNQKSKNLITMDNELVISMIDIPVMETQPWTLHPIPHSMGIIAINPDFTESILVSTTTLRETPRDNGQYLLLGRLPRVRSQCIPTAIQQNRLQDLTNCEFPALQRINEESFISASKMSIEGDIRCPKAHTKHIELKTAEILYLNKECSFIGPTVAIKNIKREHHRQATNPDKWIDIIGTKGLDNIKLSHISRGIDNVTVVLHEEQPLRYTDFTFGSQFEPYAIMERIHDRTSKPHPTDSYARRIGSYAGYGTIFVVIIGGLIMYGLYKAWRHASAAAQAAVINLQELV